MKLALTVFVIAIVAAVLPMVIDRIFHPAKNGHEAEMERTLEP